MAPQPIGPERGRLTLHTRRQGIASSAGHDLTIEIGRWSGEVERGDDPSATTVRVTAGMESLRVISGTGGVKPLSERDKREIVRNARKVLDVDHHPEATFAADRITVTGSGGTIDGTLTLHGVARPFRLDVTQSGDTRYRGTGTVVQSEHGIRPYTGFFGALKLADAVGIEVEIDLREDH